MSEQALENLTALIKKKDSNDALQNLTSLLNNKKNKTSSVKKRIVYKRNEHGQRTYPYKDQTKIKKKKKKTSQSKGYFIITYYK